MGAIIYAARVFSFICVNENLINIDFIINAVYFGGQLKISV